MLYLSALLADKGWVCRLVCLLLICGSTILPSFAQYETYDPEPTYTGQIISIDFFLTQAGNSEWFGPELTLTHTYSGFTIDSSSNIQIDTVGSGFGQGTTLDVSYTIDNQAHEITITLKRQDGDSIYTDGWVCSMHGIGVLMEDVHVREANPTPVSLDDKLIVYPNPVRNSLFVQTDSEEIEQIFLQNLRGQTVLVQVLQTDEAPIRLNLSAIPPGVYWLHLKGKNTQQQRKIVKH